MTRIVLRTMIISLFLVAGWPGWGEAQICGDVDGSGQVTVTDGVNVLRAAAGAVSCSLPLCDVDDSGSVTVTDGVNVLRVAAGLSANADCGGDPIINSIVDGAGVFGVLGKLPGGLVAPPGAAQTVQKVIFADSQNLVSGRSNTLTIEYDVGGALVQAAGTGDLSLLVASASKDGAPSPQIFDLPVSALKASLTVALTLRNDIAVNQFQLRFANGRGGTPIGQVETYNLVIIGDTEPKCGNRVLDGTETCDPPSSTCSVSSAVGVCTAECSCAVPAGPTPTPIPGARFVDNGETVTDTQTGLEWEKKTSVVGSGENFSDPHDVDNGYPWCLNAIADFVCDNPQGTNGPKDGPLFTQFLDALNTPPCFAGHCDWRVPTVGEDGGAPELETIVDLSAPGCGSGGPCLDPIFGATDTARRYWSATTYVADPRLAWRVNFFTGAKSFESKYVNYSVRAVRGGS